MLSSKISVQRSLNTQGTYVSFSRKLKSKLQNRLSGIKQKHWFSMPATRRVGPFDLRKNLTDIGSTHESDDFFSSTHPLVLKLHEALGRKELQHRSEMSSDVVRRFKEHRWRYRCVYCTIGLGVFAPAHKVLIHACVRHDASEDSEPFCLSQSSATEDIPSVSSEEFFDDSFEEFGDYVCCEPINVEGPMTVLESKNDIEEVTLKSLDENTSKGLADKENSTFTSMDACAEGTSFVTSEVEPLLKSMSEAEETMLVCMDGKARPTLECVKDEVNRTSKFMEDRGVLSLNSKNTQLELSLLCLYETELYFDERWLNSLKCLDGEFKGTSNGASVRTGVDGITLICLKFQADQEVLCALVRQDRITSKFLKDAFESNMSVVATAVGTSVPLLEGVTSVTLDVNSGNSLVFVLVVGDKHHSIGGSGFASNSLESNCENNLDCLVEEENTAVPARFEYIPSKCINDDACDNLPFSHHVEVLNMKAAATYLNDTTSKCLKSIFDDSLLPLGKKLGSHLLCPEYISSECLMDKFVCPMESVAERTLDLNRLNNEKDKTSGLPKIHLVDNSYYESDVSETTIILDDLARKVPEHKSSSSEASLFERERNACCLSDEEENDICARSLNVDGPDNVATKTSWTGLETDDQPLVEVNDFSLRLAEEINSEYPDVPVSELERIINRVGKEAGTSLASKKPAKVSTNAVTDPVNGNVAGDKTIVEAAGGAEIVAIKFCKCGGVVSLSGAPPAPPPPPPMWLATANGGPLGPPPPPPPAWLGSATGGPGLNLDPNELSKMKDLLNKNPGMGTKEASKLPFLITKNDLVLMKDRLAKPSPLALGQKPAEPTPFQVNADELKLIKKRLLKPVRNVDDGQKDARSSASGKDQPLKGLFSLRKTKVDPLVLADPKKFRVTTNEVRDMRRQLNDTRAKIWEEKEKEEAGAGPSASAASWKKGLRKTITKSGGSGETVDPKAWVKGLKKVEQEKKPMGTLLAAKSKFRGSVSHIASCFESVMEEPQGEKDA